ncbi:hypothetical protein JZX87_31155, partial [Agrobacterium sp. Ap1]|nr:hypothetical protein [Agrobacterium sp. Ap1]
TGKPNSFFRSAKISIAFSSPMPRLPGAEVVELGFSKDFIPVDTEAVSPETIASLRQWVREHGLDAIVSADGDGDRPLLSDETGEP